MREKRRIDNQRGAMAMNGERWANNLSQDCWSQMLCGGGGERSKCKMAKKCWIYSLLIYKNDYYYVNGRNITDVVIIVDVE